MSSTSGKFYKNPDRLKNEGHKPYVPQYKQMEIEPADYSSPSSLGAKSALINAVPSKDNPRMPRSIVRQPYAEVSQSIGSDLGHLPNVGNSIEQSWIGLDGEVIDDVFDEGAHKNEQMIDNNEYVTEEALGNPHIHTDAYKGVKSADKDIKDFKDIKDIIEEISEKDYLLLIDGEALCSGSFEYIQEQVRCLVFGEHEFFNGNCIALENLIVIKKIKIKAGVFLE